MAILTPQVIAREALMILINNLVIGRLVYNDKSQEFTGNEQRGDRVSIRRPSNFTIDEFSNKGPITVQDINESKAEIVLEKHFDASICVTARQLTLELDDFAAQVVEPVMAPMAEAVDNYFLSKILRVGNYVGTPGTPPASIGDLAAVNQRLNESRVPGRGRVAIVNPAAEANILQIPGIHESDRRGDGGSALESANIGRVMNLDWYMAQGVPDHTAGTAGAVTTWLTNGAFTKAVDPLLQQTSTIDIDGGVGAETFVIGDAIRIAGVGGYTVVAANTAAAGAFTAVEVYPQILVDIADNTAVTVADSHTANVAMHPNAFGFAMVPLARPMGNERSEVMSAHGVSVRVVYDYDIQQKADLISFDLLTGAEAIQPELAMRVLG